MAELANDTEEQQEELPKIQKRDLHEGASVVHTSA